MDLFDCLQDFVTHCKEAIILLQLHPEYIGVHVQCQRLPLHARCQVTNKEWVHIEYLKDAFTPVPLFKVESSDLNKLWELLHNDK